MIPGTRIVWLPDRNIIRHGVLVGPIFRGSGGFRIIFDGETQETRVYASSMQVISEKDYWYKIDSMFDLGPID